MARFHFNLETVLTQRARAEQAAQRQVALARQALVPLQDALMNLDRSRRDADEQLRTRLVGPIDVSFIGGHRRFVVSLEKQALDLARKIAEAQVLVDKAQAVLLAAARDKKAIETLKERYLERWQEEQAKKENADLDEAGMQIAFTNLTQAVDEGAS
ncbi:MAG TPA: flagellar export protein FliJ [Tepidisphaeraceae bacterium]|jgi:flagellar export protein FliJ